jgi:hypothetical protein
LEDRRGGNLYFEKMLKLTRNALFAGALIAGMAGCGQKTETPTTAPSPATSPGQTPAATDPNAGIDLAEMTRDLRRWILAKQRPPKNFEDYAATATATIPTPPPGKKFAISKEMAVVLVKK